jgi:hypothetical protein
LGFQLFANNPSTTLAANITSGSTSLQVQTGSGALFPVITPGSGNWFIVTLMKAGAPATLEIVKVTATATDTFTITRNAEGTTPALAWNTGDTVALLITAGALNGFVQAPQLQSQGGGYAIDTGAANAYVVGLTPALTAHIVGMPIRWLAGHGNTGASTFNDGAGAASMVVQLGLLGAGMITAGDIYTCIWDGTRFQLINPTIYMARGQFTGVVTGVSGSGLLTVNWTRVFDQVTLFNSTSWVSSSSNNALTLTGNGVAFPSDIIPANTKIVSASGFAFQDNGIIGGFFVDAQVLNTGFIQFYKNGGPWTVGGSKGINGPMCLSYSVQ